MKKLIGLVTALLLMAACDLSREVLNKEECLKEARREMPVRFEIIECFENFRSACVSCGAAYARDPQNGLCYLLTGWYRGRSLTFVPCEKLVP